MNNQRHEEEKIIKDIRNLFRLENEINGIEDRILADVKNVIFYRC